MRSVSNYRLRIHFFTIVDFQCNPVST